MVPPENERITHSKGPEMSVLALVKRTLALSSRDRWRSVRLGESNYESAIRHPISHSWCGRQDLSHHFACVLECEGPDLNSRFVCDIFGAGFGRSYSGRSFASSLNARFCVNESFCYSNRLGWTLNLACSADDTCVIAHNYRLLSFEAFQVLKLEHRDWAHIHAD